MTATSRRNTMKVWWYLVVVGLAVAVADRSSAEEAFSPLRLGEITPEGWLHAVLERDLSGSAAPPQVPGNLMANQVTTTPPANYVIGDTATSTPEGAA